MIKVGDNIYLGQPHDIIAGLQAEIERLRADKERLMLDNASWESTYDILQERFSAAAKLCVAAIDYVNALSRESALDADGAWTGNDQLSSEALFDRFEVARAEVERQGGPDAWVKEDGERRMSDQAKPNGPDFGELRIGGDGQSYIMQDGELRHIMQDDRRRIIDCWDACRGMADPQAEIERLRAENTRLSTLASSWEYEQGRAQRKCAKNTQLHAEIERLRNESANLVAALAEMTKDVSYLGDLCTTKDAKIEVLTARFSAAAKLCVAFNGWFDCEHESHGVTALRFSTEACERITSARVEAEALGGPEAWVQEDGTGGIGPKKEDGE